MRTLAQLLAYLGLVLILGSCSLVAPLQIPPHGIITTGTNTYQVWLPPHFADTAFTQKYPLVISLHGGTGSSDYYFAPTIVNNPQESLDYPCVFFAPNSIPGYGTSEVWIRQTIMGIITNPAYRIDPERVYLLGFSMGGFGCTSIARDLYNDYGLVAAALLPSGGGNYPDLPPGRVRANTAMWIHYGLNGDFPQETDYQAAKDYLIGAEETLINDVSIQTGWDGSIIPFTRETRTLILAGKELFKISTYAEMGHGIGPIYNDPKVLTWLFAQRVTQDHEFYR